MLEDAKIDLSAIDVRALTPEQWSTLRDQLIEQAWQRRNAELRAAAGKIFAGPERLLQVGVQTLARVRRAVLIARRRKATVAALSALDDRSLRDIGLRRGEILSTVYRTRSGRPR